MKNYSSFDILGPIMIGPSSSHTAGAARLAKTAVTIAGYNIVDVKFLLHGSFAKTYKGHGTDKALVAGILRINPWDELLKDSFEIAKKQGINFEFIETDLGEVHPNTVKFIITRESGKVTEVMGSSIGGGSIIITEIDDMEVEFTGEYPTLIIKHQDVPGMISKVSTALYNEDINIATLKVFRDEKGLLASMIFALDSNIDENIVDNIKAMANIKSVRVINSVKEGEE